LHFAHFMRAVVVHDQVDIETIGGAAGNVVQKAQELLMAMPSVTVADGDSARHIQRRNSDVTP
jgi:hypothetical protein